jgi:16S rRNA (adenine1518-N6/adenine1519-N6)-dimethyltransferase
MLFTVQEEVANRLVSGPGSKDYGLLSIMSQAYLEIEALRRIPASAFWPEPEVNAKVVKLMPTAVHLKKILDREIFADLVKTVFTWRRKTIRSCLLRGLSTLPVGQRNEKEVQRLLRAADIDPKRRPEDLSLDEFICLANLLAQACLPAGRET